MQDDYCTLSTIFATEVVPECSARINLPVALDSKSTIGNSESLKISSRNGIGSAHFTGIPGNCRITLEINLI